MLLLAWRLRARSGRAREESDQRTIGRALRLGIYVFLSQLSLHVALWERRRRLRTEAS